MKKRIFSFLLALVMVLGMFPVSAMAVESDNSVTAYFAAVDCVNGKFVYTRKALTVTPGLAKAYLGGEYGVTYVTPEWVIPVTENDVTAADVLVAAHLDKYGDAFANSVGNYIAGSNGGIDYVSTIFGETSDICYTVNGIQPYDPNGPYGATGYAINQYIVKPGDEICFYLISYYDEQNDVWALFREAEVETPVNEGVTLHLDYSTGYVDATTPAGGVDIYVLNADGSIGTTKKGTTDANGQVTVSFDAAGTYYLTCKGTASYMGDSDWDGVPDSEVTGTLSPAYCKVTVTGSAEPEHECEWDEEWSNDETHHWHECVADGCTVTESSEKNGYAEHSWNAATCSAPKTCSVCGETADEADPNAHKYVDGKCQYCGTTESVPTPFSQKLSVPANGDSTWGNINGLTLSGTDGSIYEAYWSSESNPFVLDVILGQDTDLDATITAEFSRGGSIGDRYKPTISGTLTVTLVDGKGTITMHAEAYGDAVFYPHTDWTINLVVDDGSAANRTTHEVTLPTETEGYTVTAYNSESPVIEGRDFSFKVTIDGAYKKGEAFKVLANGEELTGSGDVYTITDITEAKTVTVEGVVLKTLADKNVVVIAPAGSTIASGRHYSYFKYDFSEPLEETTLADGRIQKVFPTQSGRQGFIRVQHPEGVTYWDFDSLTAGNVFEITEEMLFIGSTEFTKETVYANFEKNVKDKADLYLTANEKGWLDLNTGDTWNLNVFRNFLSLGNTISNDCLALPDVEYKVVTVDGAPSTGVITVTPNENNNSYAEIKAVGAGTAIILVSYDAVYNCDGEGGKQWSALWPENTGVIVVTVDAEDASIATNMTVNEEANAGGKQVIDAEHDILFYVGDAGASYSFKPEEGCTVTVNSSSVGSTMTLGSFTGNGVETAADGTVTVTGLTTGAHIIKVEKDGKAVYQVIRARQVSYEVKHSDGTLVTKENPAQPGESVTIQFHRLISPMEKLSGVYNTNFAFYYIDEAGTNVSSTSSSGYGVYTFSGTPSLQKFAVTVPATWAKKTYTLTDGAIKIGGYGSNAGAHRTTTYIAGKEVNTNASGVAGILSVLPDVVIAVDADLTIPVTEVKLDKTEADMEAGGSLTLTATVLPEDATDKTVTWASSDEAVATVADGVITAVAAGEAIITAKSGDQEATCTVTVKCGHNWSDATCSAPKTCTLCGATEGEADPDAHSYVDGTCEHCGEAETVSYPFTLSVGGEVLTITDLDTTVTCSKGNKQVKALSVTVPTGTTAVSLNNVSTNKVMTYPNDGAQVLVNVGGSAEVSVSTGSYLCTMAVVDKIQYHIAIEFAPCEEHNWTDATCSAPKTCALCGATEGDADPDVHSYVDGTCEYCGAAEPVSNSYLIKLSEAEELTAGLNYFISVPAEGMDIIFDFGSGTISGAMCQRHCSKRNFWTAGEGSTLVVTAENVAAHLCNEGRRAEIAEDFDLYLTEGSQMFAFYWWTTANMAGSYIYIEILPTEEACSHETWNAATCSAPKTCADCGATEGDADPDAHSYVDGTCEYCGEAQPSAAYTIKLSEAEEMTAGLNYFISVPADAAGKDIIFDFGSGTISGMMCQRHCSKRNIHTAGEGSTLILSAETVAAHLCNESRRAEIAEDFDLYLTEGSQMLAFYWWTTANMAGSYIYIEILPAEEACSHETWNAATCSAPKTCADCGATEGDANPDAHSYVDGTCEYCGEAKAELIPFSQCIPAPSNGSKVWGYVSDLTVSGTDGSLKEYIWISESDPFVLNVVLGEDTELDTTITVDFNIGYANDRYLPTVSGETSVTLENGRGTVNATVVSGKSKSYPDTQWTIKFMVFDENAAYKVTLPTNGAGYSVRATSSPTVTFGGDFSFKLNIYDDYKKGESFKVLANGVELTASGDTYTITNVTEDQTVTIEGVVEKTLAEKNVTVIAPAGSTVSGGLFHSYFKYDFADALEVTTLADGRVQYIFPAAPGGDAFIRVQHPEGVTYWDFGGMTAGKIFDITDQMLFIGSTEYTKDTVFANYEKNGHDTASLYLTANAQGWLDMDTGDTHSLNVFRNWIPVSNSTTNTGVSLPDVTYTVVSPDGTPSDVVQVVPDANNSCYADIKAVKAGTVVILVTYDAVYNADGEGGKQFSAIWPENTGVIVVTVDAEDANIQTNITVNEEANAGGKQILDVEHDILFYVGANGAEYAFKPEAGCTVSVARSTVGSTMTFGGFTTAGVDTAEDGTVTITGLTTGSHIIKVEKDGKTAYQVIRAREVSYKLTHSDGTEVTAENPAQPGEAVTVQFSRLIDPMGKLSGVYNAKYGFRYVDEDGTVISINSTSPYGEYYFGSNAARQRFTITVPASWSKETYTIADGSIMLGGWGGTFGDHRSTTYMEGKEPNLNASGAGGYAAVMPDVVIPVYYNPSETTYAVTLPTGEGYTVTGDTSPVQEGATYTFTVTVSNGYDGTNMVVKVNGEPISCKDGLYTVEDVREDLVITVTGVKKLTVPVESVTLNKTSASLEVGQTLSLTATVTPNNATDKTVTWTSSNEAVATVKNGVVTAVSEGRATITAKSGNKKATCTVTVKAAQVSDNVKVYLSISHDADYMVGQESKKVVALQEVNVPWFDLSLYGMEEFTCEQGKPTVLHLYIYATEVYYCGLAPEAAGQGYLYDQNLMYDLLQYSGSPGSIYFLRFWGQDANLNYYVNYQYPAKDGWGITADQLVLQENDIITVGHFTDWGFYGDSYSGFNYLDMDGQNLSASVQQGEQITLRVFLANGNLFGGSSGGNAREQKLDVYYAEADALLSGVVSQWSKLGTTDSTGKLNITVDLEPGTYMLAIPGQKGVENPLAVVSAPGGLLLTVLESEAADQVQDVINLIDAIGQVTLDSEAAIIAARTAYDGLTDAQKPAVTNYGKLTDAETKLTQLQQAKADQDAADGVRAKINAIGTVTLDSKAAIEKAREAFDALTDVQKALISEATLKKLTDAETAYAKLIATEADKAAAAAAEKVIAKIGAVTLDSQKKITAARKSYDALTQTQKQLVGNYKVLTAAEEKLGELKDRAAALAVDEKIEAIGTVTLDSGKKIQAARKAYEKLTDGQKALVEKLSVLEAAEEMLELLKLAGTDVTNIYKTTGDYLAGLAAPGVGSSNGEWRVIGLSRAGRAVSDSFYEAAVKYVQENIDENGRLHAAKSTDNSRMIVVLTAIGKDVTDVGGYDLRSGLNDMTYIGNQGINGTIWALIAFDSHDYEIPAGDVTREKLVQTILHAQLSGGGWALGGNVGDPDMTGMALQALAPYYKTNSSVKKAVDKALAWLSGIQSKDGTFTCSEGVTSESLAQVITGLTALGINPETDSRFIKNGVSAVDALSKFYVAGGGFKHGLTGERNMMATEQAYYALVSYFRLLQDKTALYDMSDVTIQTAAKDQEAADAVEALIDAIGTVTKDSGDKIKAARDAYDGLTDAQKQLVENYKKLTKAETAYAQLVKTAEDEAAAKAVEEKIDAIGKVTLLSETKIKKARGAYDKLTAVQRALVGNYEKLTAAEEKLLERKDEAAADEVEKLIDAIGTVTEDSEAKIKAARDAYDALTENQKKLVENRKALTDAESKLNELKSTVSVAFTLLGCSKHGEDKVHTLADGNLSTWIAKKTYRVAPGATVKDVLEKALTEAKMSWRNPSGNYVESIRGIGEFTNGANSGWMYTLNGVHPNLGVAEQTVKDGDVIVFHYTDDYTKEASGQGFGDRDDAAAEKVEKLIDAIGTVTLDSGEKIEAARKAYNALSYTQKKLVDNYDKLTSAESKHAQLKKADDEKKADAVEALIDQLNADSATFEKDAEAAKKAYDGLTPEQKKLVENYSKLVAALKELADEEDKEAAEAVEKLILSIGTVTKDSEAKIKAAREAYDKLTEEQKALVENLSVLEAAEEKLAELKALGDTEDVYNATGDYLQTLGTPVPGSIGGEWMVIGLLRSGRSVPADYYDNVVKFVQENIDENERLHNAKSTENARLILALTAMGKDVTNVDGHNLLAGLNDMEYVRKQGINGPIWALIAFDSGNYPVPKGNVTREALIRVILDAQLSDGGWALSGSVSDPDMTGMALQALAPYYASNTDVKKAADEAVAALSMMQAADGSFASIDGTSSESVAQVVAALSALGIDADTDSRFIKNGVSALDALCAFFVEDGGFRHIPEGDLDGMATEQAYYALVAYFRMLDGKTALYDMTDVLDMGGDKAEEEPVETTPAVTEPAPTEPAVEEVATRDSFPWWLVIVIVVLAGAIVVLVIISKPKKGKYNK